MVAGAVEIDVANAVGGAVGVQRQRDVMAGRSTARLRLQYCGREPKMPVVALEGEFDIETVPEIDRFLRRTFGPFFYKQHVVLDLSGVTLIDSTFVAFVVGLLDRLHGERKELVLTRPGGHVWRVLSLVGVPNAVPVYDSIEEAIAVIRAGMLPIIPPAFAAGRLGGSIGHTAPT